MNVFSEVNPIDRPFLANQSGGRSHYICKYDYEVICMGNNSESKVVGINDVIVLTNNDTTLALRERKHIPDIQFGLYPSKSYTMMAIVVQFSVMRGNLRKV